jgi:peptidyl-prolyl cis-trans isomerase SurA
VYKRQIIKVTDKKEYPSFEDDKEELTQLYKKTNYNPDYRNYMDSLRTVYGYRLNDSVFAKVAAFVEKDTLLMNSSYWESEVHNELKDSVLYVFNNTPVTVDSFFAPLVADKKNSAKRVNKAFITTNIAPKIERNIIDAEAMKLEQRNPEFKDLMTDYKNGIFVFKLQEDEVWNKIDVDSSKVFDYFTQHQGDFTWGERVNFSEIFSKSDSLINAYYTELQNGADFDSLAARYTERMGFRVKKGEYGLTETGDSELAETAAKLNAPGDYSKPFKFENGYSIVKLIEKKPAGAKTFEEAKAEAMSSYQEKESARLEKEYVDGLKQTYKPEIHYEKLEEAFKPQE